MLRRRDAKEESGSFLFGNQKVRPSMRGANKERGSFLFSNKGGEEPKRRVTLFHAANKERGKGGEGRRRGTLSCSTTEKRGRGGERPSRRADPFVWQPKDGLSRRGVKEMDFLGNQQEKPGRGPGGEGSFFWQPTR